MAEKKTEKDVQVIKKKPRGGNSPVIGDNGLMLEAGDKYDRIEEATGASTATISRVKRCLKFGADGYVQVLSRMGKDVSKTTD